jgi:hypothetical protein
MAGDELAEKQALLTKGRTASLVGVAESCGKAKRRRSRCQFVKYLLPSFLCKLAVTLKKKENWVEDEEKVGRCTNITKTEGTP